MATSSEFIWRRFHSLMGLWLVLYLSYHLLVNSQAALWMGESGAGFIRMVNTLESLPYLHVIEVMLIGVPLLVHGVWGVKRALQPKINSVPGSGSSPTLGQYGRNQAFTWQRLTSWVLLFGILGHVAQMRFAEQPRVDGAGRYWVEVTWDEGLEPLVKRVGAELSQVENGRVCVMTATPGGAMLFMVRNTFKSPLMVGLYTVFLLSAAFHAFNGFWTFLLTWGIILSYRSQKALLPIGWIGACVLSFLGLAAIWGSYWL